MIPGLGMIAFGVLSCLVALLTERSERTERVRRAELAARRTATAAGTVTSLLRVPSSDDRRRTSLHVKISFPVGKGITKCDAGYHGDPSPFSVGEAITVRYDPTDPARTAALDSPKALLPSTHPFHLYLLVPGIVLVAGGIALLV